MGKKAQLFLLPAAVGFAALFALIFGLIASALVLVSAGLLCAPLGVLYCFGIITIVSDLSAPALTAAGCFCLSLGVLLCFVIYSFAPFCVSLLYRYVSACRGIRWRRIYFPRSHKPLIFISAGAAVISLAAACVLQYLAAESGFEGTVIRDRLEFVDVKYLYISTSNLDFELRYHSGDGIIVEYVNDTALITETSDMNDLHLVQDDAFTMSLFALEQFDYRMTVWLPENDYQDFYLDSGSGSITLYETPAERTEVRTRSGDITVIGATGRIQAESVRGSISCGCADPDGSFTFLGKSSDINVTVPGDCGVLLEFRTEKGWIESGFLGLDGRVYGSRDLKKEAETSYSIYVNTESGRFTLEANG